MCIPGVTHRCVRRTLQMVTGGSLSTEGGIHVHWGPRTVGFLPDRGGFSYAASDVYRVLLSVWNVTPATTPPRVATAVLIAALASSAIG
jgi:hypothetical protein